MPFSPITTASSTPFRPCNSLWNPHAFVCFICVSKALRFCCGLDVLLADRRGASQRGGGFFKQQKANAGTDNKSTPPPHLKYFPPSVSIDMIATPSCESRARREWTRFTSQAAIISLPFLPPSLSPSLPSSPPFPHHVSIDRHGCSSGHNGRHRN